MAASLVAIALFSSCASTEGSDGRYGSGSSKPLKFDQKIFDEAFQSGEYGICARMLKGKKKSNSRVREFLDADILSFMASNYLDSGRGSLQTKSEMQKISSGMTAGKVLQASFAGENSVAYSGAVYERYYLYSLRAMNAIQLNSMDSALGVMSDYAGTYQSLIEEYRNLQQKIQEESVKSSSGNDVTSCLEQCSKSGIAFGSKSDIFTAAPVPLVSDTYMNSPLLGYLGTVIYAANASSGNSDREHAYQFASDNLMGTEILQDMRDDLDIPDGKGRLDVVALSGSIGKRKEFSTGLRPLFIFDGIPIMYKVTYPMFDRNSQNHVISSVKATLTNGDSSDLILVEDFDEAVAGDVASKAAGARGRSVTRNVVKNVMAVVPVVTADILAENAPSDLAKQIAVAASVAAKITLQLTMDKIIDAEYADVRQCEYLPHRASAKGFTVEPGVYDIKVEYFDRSGNLVYEDESNKDVVVDSGKLNMVVSLCRM